MRIPRRALLAGFAAAPGAALLTPRTASAFGEEGAFNPRVLLTGDQRWEGVRTTAPKRWAAELAKRTSAPGRERPTVVRAEEEDLLDEPFVVWSGSKDVAALTAKELRRLKQYFALGGILFVDDSDPKSGAFLAAAKREVARALPNVGPVAVGAENILFRSFYLLKRPYGRVEGPAKLEIVSRSSIIQVVYSSHDLLGALATDAEGTASLEVVPGGEAQREKAIRLAVNLAMYVTCSTYKDDQVHAEHIMRRRGSK
jgi:hypothetical protein